MVKRIGIMIGSDSDLRQCREGFGYLKEKKEEGLAEVVVVITNSIHRNTEEVLENLIRFTPLVDAWIIGAGAANHLTGTCDAYLRYELKNDTVAVFGVGFEDEKNPKNTRAARLGITQVPGTQVTLCDNFQQACSLAVYGPYARIILKEPKPVVIRTLDDALAEAQKGGTNAR